MKNNSPFINKINQLFVAINKCNPFLLVLIVLCAHFLSFYPTGNEECYFPLAKQFVNPNWMPESFVFNEWAGTRILFQYISGFFLQFLSFEQLAFWGRLVIFIISAYPLTKLFKHFNFSNVSILILLEIFLVRQSWIGGSSIFGGLEAKSFAYIFVLFSLLSLFKDKYYKSIFLAVAASYFHILVGGWYTVFMLTYIMLFKRSIITPVKFGIVYATLMAPLLYFLSSHIIGSGSIINGVNIDWVYTYYRNPHHCVPFSRPDWINVVLPSLIQLLGTTILVVFVLRKKKSILNRKFFWMTIVIHVMIWMAILVSIINTSGSISKYYLYRVNAVGALIFYMYIFWWTLKHYPSFARKAGYILFFLVFIPSFAGRTTSNIKKHYVKGYSDEYMALVEYIKTNTDEDAIFIEYSKILPSFMRKVERESFVVKKLVPGGGEKIYEWYIRMQLLEDFRKDTNVLQQIKANYTIDYIVSKESLDIKNIQLEYSNASYYLYKIED